MKKGRNQFLIIVYEKSDVVRRLTIFWEACVPTRRSSDSMTDSTVIEKYLTDLNLLQNGVKNFEMKWMDHDVSIVRVYSMRTR